MPLSFMFFQSISHKFSRKMLKKTSLPNSNCYSDPVASAAIHLNCTYRLFVQLLNGENLDDKYATGVTKIKKIRDRENISVGTGIKGL